MEEIWSTEANEAQEQNLNFRKCRKTLRDFREKEKEGLGTSWRTSEKF